MVKTTINLDDELYKRLVEESIRRFGSTKKNIFFDKRKIKES
jgi:hypothetical protein